MLFELNVPGFSSATADTHLLWVVFINYNRFWQNILLNKLKIFGDGGDSNREPSGPDANALPLSYRH